MLSVLLTRIRRWTLDTQIL